MNVCPNYFALTTKGIVLGFFLAHLSHSDKGSFKKCDWSSSIFVIRPSVPPLTIELKDNYS